ncbi:uncharacterized protein LOC136027565 [Artemia franciscana]|uniref:Uncharacterized protein n=1 Tax=Artemia franciscana TaxID=6661 RepID=A0AA88HDG2_ARTSF|nr:hypothetical protein QYM36_013612 [Artemia franciscana]
MDFNFMVIFAALFGSSWPKPAFKFIRIEDAYGRPYLLNENDGNWWVRNIHKAYPPYVENAEIELHSWLEQQVPRLNEELVPRSRGVAQIRDVTRSLLQENELSITNSDTTHREGLPFESFQALILEPQQRFNRARNDQMTTEVEREATVVDTQEETDSLELLELQDTEAEAEDTMEQQSLSAKENLENILVVDENDNEGTTNMPIMETDGQPLELVEEELRNMVQRDEDTDEVQSASQDEVQTTELLDVQDTEAEEKLENKVLFVDEKDDESTNMPDIENNIQPLEIVEEELRNMVQTDGDTNLFLNESSPSSSTISEDNVRPLIIMAVPIEEINNEETGLNDRQDFLPAHSEITNNSEPPISDQDIFEDYTIQERLPQTERGEGTPERINDIDYEASGDFSGDYQDTEVQSRNIQAFKREVRPDDRENMKFRKFSEIRNDPGDVVKIHENNETKISGVNDRKLNRVIKTIKGVVDTTAKLKEFNQQKDKDIINESRENEKATRREEEKQNQRTNTSDSAKLTTARDPLQSTSVPTMTDEKSASPVSATRILFSLHKDKA